MATDVIKKEHTLIAGDGLNLAVRTWEPIEGRTRIGIIQVVHGMAEHCERYDVFALEAVKRGYVVVADDHRGHGKTMSEEIGQGFLGHRNGWANVLTDLHRITMWAKERYAPSRGGQVLPFVMLGHSWGSLLARHYAIQWGNELDALVVMGTAGHPGVAGVAGYALANAQCRIHGADHPSQLLSDLAFGSANSRIDEPRTVFDWLSRKPEEVNAYLRDPWCGFTCTAGFFRDLTAGTLYVNTLKNVRRVPQDLPIHLFSGAMDPVGNYGAGVRAVAAQYRRAGIARINLTLYPGARHELFHETNAQEVIVDVLDWLDEISR
ncbi:alpha/beta fold hydrolase [Actinomyces vulturis]|uniref:alpha/beta fold hydrolase n=1 Tax=Actinomyces vulturis TaxID=1857645 RepID=UPI00083267ED|nr:alpha/beta hydrolase [Actinomyces vulturis]